MRVNATDRASIRALVVKTIERLGQLNAMFNNAGIIETASHLETTDSVESLQRDRVTEIAAARILTTHAIPRRTVAVSASD